MTASYNPPVITNQGATNSDISTFNLNTDEGVDGLNGCLSIN